MDGLRSGLIVLTHSVSARGYEQMVESGCMYVYSDYASFETELIKMLNSHLGRQEVMSSYITHFSFHAGVDRLKQLESLKTGE